MDLRLAFWCAVLLVLVSAKAYGQPWPPLDEPADVESTGAADVAVIVAVEDYVFMPDVPGARTNARDWESFLREGLGVSTVLTLVNEQGVREEMLEAAARAVGQAQEGSTLWFVFIGHGAPAADGSDGYLVGADSQQNPRSIESRGVLRRELLATLEAGPQKRTVVLFDACFSGQTASGQPLAEGIQPAVPVTAVATASIGTVVLAAAQSDEHAGSLPGVNRPAFSYLTLGALRGWADDGDGNVTAAEAVEFARRELLAVPGRRQTPQVFGLENAVLTTGVSEKRPRAGVTEETVEVPVVTTKREPAVDDLYRSPLYARLGVGIAGEVAYERSTLAIEGGAGFRLTDWHSKPHVRLGVNVSYFTRPNDYAQAYDRARDEFAAEFGQTLPPLENGETNHLMMFGVGPGLAWSSHSDFGFALDSFVGPTVAPAGQCQGWSDRFECNRREGILDPAVQLRAALRWRMADIGLFGRWVNAERYYLDLDDGSEETAREAELYAGVTVGFVLDR